MTAKPSAHKLGLIWGLITAAALKVVLVLSGAVPFNADEAVVGLMARHILQGKWPVFFYGQAYMGSLDAVLIAGSFQVFGQRVIGIRVVQILLYLVYLYTSWRIGGRSLSGGSNRWIPWLLAVPPVLLTLYTSATLGGYGETLVLGNLILLLGWKILRTDWGERKLPWLVIGVITGLAFWTLALSLVYSIPILLEILWRYRHRKVSYYLLALLGFLIASSPLWFYMFEHLGQSLSLITEGTSYASTPLERFMGMLVLGLPALLGLRYPWSGDFVDLPFQILIIGLYTILGAALIKSYRDKNTITRQGWGRLLLLLGLSLLGLFIFTPFGVDPTGRYFLPLYLPLVIVLAWFLDRLSHWRSWAPYVLVSVYLASNAGLTIQAASLPPRITTQFDPISAFDNRYDQVLIDFLEEEGEYYGYSNYWVSYRIAFLSQERIIFIPELPYKEDFKYTPRDNRYAPYDRQVEEAERVAYITTNHPALDRQLRQAFNDKGIQFSEKQVGPYHIFYDLTVRITPSELDLDFIGGENS